MKPWDRTFWAIEFNPHYYDEPPMLLGDRWYPEVSERYAGEPTRVLLFLTKRQAKAYCDQEHQRYRKLGNAISSQWRFRPIKVRETVTPYKV